MKSLTFHEEMHAIDAVLNGTGIMIVSDFLVAQELLQRKLAIAMEFKLPGYGFYVTYHTDHPHKSIFDSFTRWAVAQLDNGVGDT